MEQHWLLCVKTLTAAAGTPYHGGGHTQPTLIKRCWVNCRCYSVLFIYFLPIWVMFLSTAPLAHILHSTKLLMYLPVCFLTRVWPSIPKRLGEPVVTKNGAHSTPQDKLNQPIVSYTRR